ncbi:MAG TPA: tetratricopeptide repeat protein [Nocardioidaceae bacterium]|nr:tetratricopeptide repeat protein [Nocardioidaceae bacterium]
MTSIRLHAPNPGMDAVERYHEAWRLLEGRQPLDAINILDPAVDAEPDSLSLRTLRGWAYFQSAQLRKAEADLRVIVEEQPTDLWARFALGRTLERQSRLAEALPHLRMCAVMSADPEHEAAVLRVERRMAERGERSYDDLTEG